MKGKNIGIALNNGNPRRRNIITRHLHSSNSEYWHWIDDFWIWQVTPDYTPLIVRDELQALDPEISMSHLLVFEMPGGIDWAGRNVPAAFAWLRKFGRSE